MRTARRYHGDPIETLRTAGHIGISEYVAALAYRAGYESALPSLPTSHGSDVTAPPRHGAAHVERRANSISIHDYERRVSERLGHKAVEDLRAVVGEMRSFRSVSSSGRGVVSARERVVTALKIMAA